MTRDELVHACRVRATVPERRVGLWEIRRMAVPEWHSVLGAREQIRAFLGLGDYEDYTVLSRTTMATLHKDIGEVVMEDTPRELRRHLPVLLNASGRVLISGLGLGCVVRGLLAKPSVTHIDVVEIDRSILALVGAEFSDDPRVTLHLGDAETIEWPADTRWDFAWHDVWSELEHLDVVHARLLMRYRHMATVQGAWQFNRPVKRRWPDALLNAPARRRRAVA